MQAVDVVRKWFEVVTDPYSFYSRINAEEVGQKNALVYFVLVVILGRVPSFYDGPTFRFFILTAVLLLVSPALLHVITGLQYLLVWIITEKDEGVDRTLRAVAYSTAPGVFSWIPGVGIVAVYGIYLQYVGIRQGHDLGRLQAGSAVVLPAFLVYLVGFPSYEHAKIIFEVSRGFL